VTIEPRFVFIIDNKLSSKDKSQIKKTKDKPAEKYTIKRYFMGQTSLIKKNSCKT